MIVVDTGPLVAAAVANDRHHTACVELFSRLRRDRRSLVIPGPVPLGTSDASVIAVAERLGVTDVATLDQRHFRLVRPRHVEAFTLFPS